MRTRLTPRGHVTIPRRVCQIIGLEPGDLLTVEIADNDSILIRKVHEYDKAFNLTIAAEIDAVLADEDREPFDLP